MLSVIAQLPASGVILATRSIQEGPPAPKSHVMMPTVISAQVLQPVLATAALKPTMWIPTTTVHSAIAP